MQIERFIATIEIKKENTIVEEHFLVEGEENRRRIAALWLKNTAIKKIVFTDFEDFSNP